MPWLAALAMTSPENTFEDAELIQTEAKPLDVIVLCKTEFAVAPVVNTTPYPP